MRLDQIVDRWIRILELVKESNTGDPALFAAQLGVSTVTLYKDIKFLNMIIHSGLLLTIEAPIQYDTERKTYIFGDGR